MSLATTTKSKSLQKRHSKAAQDAEAALDLFSVAAARLDAAADAHDEIADEANAEAARLLDVHDSARTHSASSRNKADQIRKTFGIV